MRKAASFCFEALERIAVRDVPLLVLLLLLLLLLFVLLFPLVPVSTLAISFP